MKAPHKKRALWDAIASETRAGRPVTIVRAGEIAGAKINEDISTSMLYKARQEWVAHGWLKSVGYDGDTQGELYVAQGTPDQFVAVKWDPQMDGVEGDGDAPEYVAL